MKGGCKEGAQIHLQGQCHSCILKSLVVQQCLNVSKIHLKTVFVLCTSQLGVLYGCFGALPGTIPFFTNKLTLPRGFSPDPFRVLSSVYLSLCIPVTDALPAWLLRNEGKGGTRPPAREDRLPSLTSQSTFWWGAGAQPEGRAAPPSPGRSEGGCRPRRRHFAAPPALSAGPGPGQRRRLLPAPGRAGREAGKGRGAAGPL